MNFTKEFTIKNKFTLGDLVKGVYFLNYNILLKIQLIPKFW